MRKVYVPNKSFHDFAQAKQFGELVFLTEGTIHDRANINHLYRQINEGLAEASKDDLLLVSGMGLLNAITASLLAARFGRVNYLIFFPRQKGKNPYMIREVVIPLGEAFTPSYEEEGEAME